MDLIRGVGRFWDLRCPVPIRDTGGGMDPAGMAQAYAEYLVYPLLALIALGGIMVIQHRHQQLCTAYATLVAAGWGVIFHWMGTWSLWFMEVRDAEHVQRIATADMPFWLTMFAIGSLVVCYKLAASVLEMITTEDRGLVWISEGLTLVLLAPMLWQIMVWPLQIWLWYGDQIASFFEL